jgi:hypothetical protein
MAELTAKGKLYKLRAGSPMPTSTEGKFILQTFGSEHNNITQYIITNELPSSDDLRGAGGPYISAKFNRLPGTGGVNYTGQVVFNPTFEDEDVK